MSERVRLGNMYHHGKYGEVLTVYHDEKNQIWFREIESRDNAGVISTSTSIDKQPYKEFLGNVSMKDYPPDDEWDARRKAVFKRDDYTCQGCGDKDADQLHCHHICPLGAGGSNARSNLITLCNECHGRVHGGVT